MFAIKLLHFFLETHHIYSWKSQEKGKRKVQEREEDEESFSLYLLLGSSRGFETLFSCLVDDLGTLIVDGGDEDCG